MRPKPLTPVLQNFYKKLMGYWLPLLWYKKLMGYWLPLLWMAHLFLQKTHGVLAATPVDAS